MNSAAANTVAANTTAVANMMAAAQHNNVGQILCQRGNSTSAAAATLDVGESRWRRRKTAARVGGKPRRQRPNTTIANTATARKLCTLIE